MTTSRAHVRSKLIFRNAQTGLFEGDPRDLVTAESLPAWLLKTIDRLDTSCVRALFHDHGGVPYDPRMFLGIVFLAAFLNRASSREIEDSCRFDVRFMHIAGGQTPDYRTIARFRARIAPVMHELFKQVVRLGMEDGLVSLGRVSLDSTKVASAASRFSKKFTEDCSGDLEDGFSDPDAVRLVSRGTERLLGYTVQAAVDNETNFVVAVEVTQDKNDKKALAPMLGKIEWTTGFRPSELVCDSGCDSCSNHQVLVDARVTGYVPAQESDRGFWTALGEFPLCPMGHPALPGKAKFYRGKWFRPHRVRECPRCVFKPSCCPKGRGRQLEAPVGVSPLTRILAMRRVSSTEGRQAMRERMASIEPVFGDMKWNYGLNRLTHRTLQKAEAELLRFFTVRNLKKLYKADFRRSSRIFGPFFGRNGLRTSTLDKPNAVSSS